MMADWSSAVRKPPPHRINKEGMINSDCYMIHKHTFICILILLCSFVFMLVYLPNEHHCKLKSQGLWFTGRQEDSVTFNETYPLSKPEISDDGSIIYRIAIIADLDHRSKVHDKEHTWRSFIHKGRLTMHRSNQISIEWDRDLISIYSTLSQGGRGMELSDLKVFNGHLLTIDDRTGVVYKIVDHKALAWALLNDGDGSEPKGFKGEWLAVKENLLYIGGLGKEWTTTEGVFVNYNPMFVKTISASGQILHHNWTKHYIDIRAAAGINYPGYMIHESAQWSPIHKKWFFLPRRASESTYSEKTDERSATNFLIEVDENFTNFKVRRIGDLSLTRGFSAFQFVPNTNDNIIVALKSEEDDGVVASYILAFDLQRGEMVMPEIKLDGAYKFEGIEFI